MRFKPIIGVILSTLILLLIIESICYALVDDTHFMWDFSSLSSPIERPESGFHEIDPLLGYAKTEQEQTKKGFVVEKGCVVLSDNNDTSGQINILITGGSTSDLSLYPDMWPIELDKILKAKGINAKLYCAGTGGYNSGQELLKLIRDGISTNPVIHISYSGANDYGGKSYVSEFEQHLYTIQLNKGTTSWLMPSTIVFLRKCLKLDHPDINLRPLDKIPGFEFWVENMRLMHGIASEHNYHFIGILQPVVGGGKYTQTIQGEEEAIKENKERYPKIKNVLGRYPDFMTDLSAIFDTCKGNVFIDNCHINQQYQRLVAENIYLVLKQRQLLK